MVPVYVQLFKLCLLLILVGYLLNWDILCDNAQGLSHEHKADRHRIRLCQSFHLPARYLKDLFAGFMILVKGELFLVAPFEQLQPALLQPQKAFAILISHPSHTSYGW